MLSNIKSKNSRGYLIQFEDIEIPQKKDSDMCTLNSPSLFEKGCA
jgi:hypothetical protein